MAECEVIEIEQAAVTIAFTARSDGDLRITADEAELADRRRRIVDRPWTWLRQVHGAEVLTITAAGQGSGSEADGAWTRTPGCPLAVMTADCAPVVLVAEQGFAVVHAGWRGLVGGIVEVAAQRLLEGAGSPVAARVGPCINPAGYEFGSADLALATSALGAEVQAETAWGAPALDVPTAVQVACERAGWPAPPSRPACTTDDRWFSHRTRTDIGRQAGVAWMTAMGR